MEEKRIDNVQLLLIGGSAGSLEVILEVLPNLPTNLSIPVVIILHRKNFNDLLLIDLLSIKLSLPVKEAEEKEMIRPGIVYIAPADYHLLVEKDKTFSLDDSERVNYSRPSIDVTFESAADVYGPTILALLLSGASADGTEGLKAVKQNGGVCVVQDPAWAEVGYMPQQAIRHVAIDKVVNNNELKELVRSLKKE